MATGGGRRQGLLLGLLGVALVAWVWMGGHLPGAESEIDPANLPNIDAEGVSRNLSRVSTVDHTLIAIQKPDSHPDRDLFQYGAARPSAAELEAQRRAAEEAVKRQEEMARAQKAQQGQQIAQAPTPPPPTPEELAAQAEAERLRQLQAQLQAPPPVVPQGPVRKPPPPINFRFMGVMGPPERKVAVLMEGDSMVLARKGEVIQGKYRVLDIAVEWAEIGLTDPEHKDFRKRLNFGM